MPPPENDSISQSSSKQSRYRLEWLMATAMILISAAMLLFLAFTGTFGSTSTSRSGPTSADSTRGRLGAGACAISVRNLSRFSPLSIEPYSSLATHPPKFILDAHGSLPYSWLADQIDADGYKHRVLGPSLTSTVWEITSSPTPASLKPSLR